jgi:hypothetical protein
MEGSGSMASTVTAAQTSTPLSDDRPGNNPPVKAQIFGSATRALLGYCLAALAIVIGWIGRNERNITAEDGLGYWLGIVGGLMMLSIFFYSARKRYRWLRFMGATKHWFRFHMIGGVIGPVLILYHCNFELGSLNSRVALYCTLLVAGSGLVGRYLYAQFHHGLYGHKSNLQELTSRLQESVEKWSGGNALVTELQEYLVHVDQRVLVAPNTLMESALRPFSIAWQTRWAYVHLSWQLRKKLIARAMLSPAVAEHRKRLEATTQRYIRQHLRQVRKVAQLGFYERLFSLWHIVHVPFLFMLIFAAIVHILAVHMY